MYYIYNGKILLNNKVIKDKAIIFSNKIEKLVNINSSELNNLKGIDAKGNYISAGFIDIHIHGYDTKDTMDCTQEAIETIAKGIVKNGVTSFLPTTMSMSKKDIQLALDMARNLKNTPPISGAEVLGVHMEGPYFNLKFMGAQNPEYIISPTENDIKFIRENADIIKLITLSPEIDGAIDFIKAIKQYTDITISMGHTGATFEQAIKGIDAGITSATHLFNAMTPLHHRDPGVVGAVLTTDIYCELICDTIHVHSALFELIEKLKSPNKLILITDSMRAGGCQDGEYSLGGQKVLVKHGAARLENGALAGSVLTLNRALYNILNNSNIKIEEAINYVTLNPAKLIKVDKYKGSLDIGKDADIVIFDKDINIISTFNKGALTNTGS